MRQPGFTKLLFNREIVADLTHMCWCGVPREGTEARAIKYLVKVHQALGSDIERTLHELRWMGAVADGAMQSEEGAMFKAYLRPFLEEFDKIPASNTSPKPAKKKRELPRGLATLIDKTGFLIPRRSRDAVMGDLWEDARDMHAKKRSAAFIFSLVTWHLILVAVHSLLSICFRAVAKLLPAAIKAWRQANK